jgi:polyphosphate kinase
MIDVEIANAERGKTAYIIMKMNSLADEETIAKLYDASNAGVKIQLIVRGMCCLVPGVPGYSENIEVISIIDKYLEHARIYIFGNEGNERMYLSSADLMTRNLDHRVEVGFPVLDHHIKQEIRDIVNIQLKDNTKAREINRFNNNQYKKNKGKVSYRAQVDTYTYLKYKS